jgi:hypothetical protein
VGVLGTWSVGESESLEQNMKRIILLYFNMMFCKIKSEMLIVECFVKLDS